MKKIFLSLFVFLSFGCGSSNSSPNIIHYRYIFNNSSLGPINGRQELRITIENNKIKEAIDIVTGKKVPIKHIKGINAFKKAVAHQTDGFDIKYDKDGTPVYIRRLSSSKQLGAGYTITIKKDNK